MRKLYQRIKPEDRIWLILLLISVLAIPLIIGAKQNYKKKQAASQHAYQQSHNPADQTGSTLTFVKTQTTIDVKPVEEKMADVGILITQEYDFTDVINYTQSRSWFVIPVGQSSFIISYDGTVTAGIDCEKISIQRDDTNRTITATLPRATIREVAIDHSSLQVYEEKNKGFGKLNVTNFNSALVELEEKAKARALEHDILTKADKNAREKVENLIIGVLGKTDYIISVVTR